MKAVLFSARWGIYNLTEKTESKYQAVRGRFVAAQSWARRALDLERYFTQYNVSGARKRDILRRIALGNPGGSFRSNIALVLRCERRKETDEIYLLRTI